MESNQRSMSIIDQTIQCLDKGFVRLVNHMGDDSSIVQAARVSYGKGTKTIHEDRGLIRYLIRNKHTSPLEMCEFVFHLKMPIFVHNQLVRHRTASMNVTSGRYSEMPDEFYVPTENMVTFQSSVNKQGGSDDIITPLNIKNPDDWWDCLSAEEVASTWSWADIFSDEQEIVRKNYERYLNSGMRKELARINLPLSQYTELYWKIDLHNLFHFLRLRLDGHAQYEIRVYAEAIYKIIQNIVPIACEAFDDYILSSVSFSKIELQALEELINLSEANIEGVANSLIGNKREKQEFLNKIERFVRKL